MYYILFYQYVDNIEEKRAPYRPDHLALAKSFNEAGNMPLVGVTGTPINGAILVFNVDNEAQVKEFVNQDPYVKNGLVTDWRIESWNIVIGSELI